MIRLATLWMVLIGGYTQLASANSWTLSWQHWNDTQFSDNSVTTNNNPIARDQYLIRYRHRKDDANHIYTYAHQPLLIRTGEPAHNGYFHRLDYTYLNQFDRWQLELELGLHGSSNMFNHVKFHRDAVVATAEIGYQLNKIYSLGLSGDYRFGHFRLYPVFSTEFSITDTGKIEMTVPNQIHFVSVDDGWRLGLKRFGEKWGALDRDREIESAYYLEEWQVHAQYRIVKNLYGGELFLRAGYSFDTRIRYFDLLAGDREENLDSAYFVGLEFAF